MLASNSDHSSIETVKLLIEKGANLDIQKSNGWTILMHYIYHINDTNFEIFELLLEKNANLDIQNNDGQTLSPKEQVRKY
jgi:ankyrin repeat protein